jgi:hypothetical protein
MPKQSIDYSRTVIYKLQHIEDDSLLYVGSTTDFTRRKSEHKSACNNINGTTYNQKKYLMIRDNGGWDNFIMVEIEKFPCRDSREARRREDELMREMKANMNMRKSHCGYETKKEYGNEKISCECGCTTARKHMARHRKTKKHIKLMNALNNQQ